MKKIALLMAALAFSAGACAADQARLGLWITDPIGDSSGIQCHRDNLADVAVPAVPPSLTERDVIAWNPEQGRWTLDPARFGGPAGEAKLVERCFILAIDGKPVGTGVVLSEQTPRLTGFPTMSVLNRNNLLDLQITTGNHRNMRLMHTDALKSVLGQKPAPAAK